MRVLVTIGTRDGSAMAITGGAGKCSGARGQMNLPHRKSKGAEFDFPCELE